MPTFEHFPLVILSRASDQVTAQLLELIPPASSLESCTKHRPWIQFQPVMLSRSIPERLPAPCFEPCTLKVEYYNYILLHQSHHAGLQAPSFWNHFQPVISDLAWSNCSMLGADTVPPAPILKSWASTKLHVLCHTVQTLTVITRTPRSPVKSATRSPLVLSKLSVAALGSRDR
jgi:hypothetical protein